MKLSQSIVKSVRFFVCLLSYLGLTACAGLLPDSAASHNPPDSSAHLLSHATDLALSLFSSQAKEKAFQAEKQKLLDDLQQQQQRALDEQKRADEALRRADTEQRRAEAEQRRADGLNDRVRMAEARVLELQTKIDALKGIEKSLSERGSRGAASGQSGNKQEGER